MDVYTFHFDSKEALFLVGIVLFFKRLTKVIKKVILQVKKRLILNDMLPLR